MLNADRLRELVHYSPDTGEFTWRPRPSSYFNSLRAERAWQAKYEGKPAGHHNLTLGYISIRVLDIAYWAHRLAWLYTTGCWPTGEIDHIDGNRSNNRIANLRDVSKSGNMQNLRSAVKTKTSSLPLGVYFAKRATPLTKPYFSHIRDPQTGASVHLGYFGTAQEASDAYLLAKRAMHAGCTI